MTVKKAAVFAAFILICSLKELPVYSQAGRVTTSTGQTEFFSKAAGPAQDIYAIDKTGQVRLDAVTGSIEVKLDMKSFSLPKSLMQKHYNQRYMHTDRFPNAVFKGKIDNWKQPEGSDPVRATASGDLTVHGVTRKKQIAGTVTRKGDTYTIEAEFEVLLKDHNIEVPVLFFTTITEKIRVKARYDLNP